MSQTQVTKAMVWAAKNVSTFRCYGLNKYHEVELTDQEYIDVLDEVYGDVDVCGYSYSSGSLLEGQDPVAFRVGKVDHESYIQSELEDALDSEDDSDIEFAEFEPADITEEDGE